MSFTALAGCSFGAAAVDAAAAIVATCAGSTVRIAASALGEGGGAATAEDVTAGAPLSLGFVLETRTVADAEEDAVVGGGTAGGGSLPPHAAAANGDSARSQKNAEREDDIRKTSLVSESRGRLSV
jgi:hypothetical protein